MQKTLLRSYLMCLNDCYFIRATLTMLQFDIYIALLFF